MQATFQAKIADESLYPALDAIAEWYGRAKRHLYVRGRDCSECKSEYLVRFGLTARQFNAIRITWGGEVEAAREGLLLRIAKLRAAVAAAEKTVAKEPRLTKVGRVDTAATGSYRGVGAVCHGVTLGPTVLDRGPALQPGGS